MVGLTIMSQQFFLSSHDFPGIEVAEASMRQRKERDSQGVLLPLADWTEALQSSSYIWAENRGYSLPPGLTLLPTLASCILLSGMTAIPPLSCALV